MIADAVTVCPRLRVSLKSFLGHFCKRATNQHWNETLIQKRLEFGLNWRVVALRERYYVRFTSFEFLCRSHFRLRFSPTTAEKLVPSDVRLFMKPLASLGHAIG